MKKFLLFVLPALMMKLPVAAQLAAAKVKTEYGTVAGLEADGIRIFKGIPYAAPPVGQFRWREPQPLKPWKGLRKTQAFGPRPMQRPIFSDMQFRSNGVSEDCLYLNVWTPAQTGKEKFPVLVYFYGGGFMAGDGSEYRYDGESMSRRGIVAITVNYRLGPFGFFAHPELTKESPHHASGNYGLLDQAAALQWVKKNIAAFGGDPDKITIAGESAGSFSVSAQMATPLARTLIAGAIGESGSLLGKTSVIPLRDAEANGEKFAAICKVKTLEELRQLPAEKILEYSANHEWELFRVAVDGYLFPKSPTEIFAAGEQAQVPLMAGWNSEEGGAGSILGKDPATVINYEKGVRRMFGDRAAKFLEHYYPLSDAEVPQVARELASDLFIGFGTWKWIEMQRQSSNQPVYRYYYLRPRPGSEGASHSAEIEYAMGNLSTNKAFAWTPDDYKVSATLQAYFANFIKTGNPNGAGLPEWKPLPKSGPVPVLHIDLDTRLEMESHRDRYEWMDQN